MSLFGRQTSRHVSHSDVLPNVLLTINGSNLHDTGHSIELTPAAAMVEQLSVARQGTEGTIRRRITPASSPTFICHTDVQHERGRSNLYLSVFLSQDPAVLLKQAVT